MGVFHDYNVIANQWLNFDLLLENQTIPEQANQKVQFK